MHVQPPGTGKKLQIAGAGQVPPHDPMPPIARHAPGTQPHAPVSGSWTQSSWSDGQSPPQVPPASRPQAGGTGLLVVDVDEVVVVVALQPVAPHASQQLGTDDAHALPPFGATQRAALRFSEHEVLPELRVRQHATKPGLPHVDLEAQRLTTPAQPLLTSEALASSAAQVT
jgi:hypothetical protein